MKMGATSNDELKITGIILHELPFLGLTRFVQVRNVVIRHHGICYCPSLFTIISYRSVGHSGMDVSVSKTAVKHLKTKFYVIAMHRIEQ